ncbi:MAG: MerC domain-containing protein [Novosphingobium sp.]
MRAAILSIRDRLDRAGVLLSGLCALHCLLSIFAVSTLGLSSQFLLSPWIHRAGLGLAIAVGIVTIGFGAVRHQRMDNLQIGAGGLGLMAGGLFVDHGTAEALLTVCGVCLVALAHLRNLKLLD